MKMFWEDTLSVTYKWVLFGMYSGGCVFITIRKLLLVFQIIIITSPSIEKITINEWGRERERGRKKMKGLPLNKHQSYFN